MRLLFSFLLISSMCLTVHGQEKIDAAMMEKIRNEGLHNSKVMEIAFYLTDVNGPRLQGSPGYNKAANWSKTKLAEWGLSSKLEAWGQWGQGWELQKSYVAMTSPYYRPLIGFPKAWCAGTDGLKKAELVLIEAKDSIALQQYAGKLKGKFIVVPRTDTLVPSFTADARRFDEEALSRMANFTPAAPGTTGGRRTMPVSSQVNVNTLKRFLEKEGAAAVFTASPRGKDGTLFVSGGGSYAPGAPANFLDIMLALEDYMSLYRLAKNNIPVTLEADVAVKFFADDTKGYNVIGEITGSDKKLKEEIVMIGAHLDSWHGSTGATDNAAGSAVMMEAVRILKALKVSPKRTIRIALWGGEEQGLHGSRNYVRNHFTDTVTRKSNAAGEKISAYFNLDNGTGKIRGVYLQGNAGVQNIFTSWLAPFADLDAKTLTLQNTGGTDHLAFDAVGIPGFQFIQDPIEYNSRTHHTNMDSFDHLLADDLKQAATVVAAFIYNAAMRDEKLPRKK